MQRTAPAHLEALRSLPGCHAQGQVPLQFPVQPLLQVPTGHKLTLLSRKRTCVHCERHRHRRLLHSDCWQRLLVCRVTQRVPDADVRQTGQTANITSNHLVHGLAVEVIVDKQLGNFALPRFLIRQAQSHGISLHNRPAVHAPDRNPSFVLIIIQRAHLHARRARHIHLGRWHLPHDGLEQRLQIPCQVTRLVPGNATHTRRIHHRKITLLIASLQLAEQIEHRVDDVVRPCSWTVNLVHHDDHLFVQRQRLPQHKARLRHRTLDRIHQQQHAVRHVQHALHLPSEIRVPRGINDVNLLVLVRDGRVLRQNRDTTLALEIIGIHDTRLHRLIGAEHLGLLEHGINKGRLAVIDVGNDGNVAHVVIATGRVDLSLLLHRGGTDADRRGMQPRPLLERSCGNGQGARRLDCTSANLSNTGARHSTQDASCTVLRAPQERRR
mmetsp:Transcript_5914/g.16562  ORF Transcript_5914/g.16562 Transcript_5914/m.16562 type:complete len:439 (+) Transcript_5914:770-2086(+)